MVLSDEIMQVLQQGSDEEKELLRLTLQAIHQKRERSSAYLSGFMGLSGQFIDKDTYEFRIPITPFMMNSIGIVHGGIIASLADSTMGSLVNKSIPDGSGAVTSELKINYLRPGIGKELISRAKLVHKGYTLVVSQCEITNERGQKIAFATSTFYVIKKG
ncbi:PaaI family thioesterase [Thermoflavimicrobium daqui]|uniref:PaaI family thioesterase n=1 Tax=Thermoflavimicrobium daqui TaxID=2137476 RepID=A0A364K5V5_9BACL|nr:PaaI family thioesterase [Thermoflavimicrobium daqui]RAL25667.1 PaaI family thioesterase [Thermoflavimicrobium daqui]